MRTILYGQAILYGMLALACGVTCNANADALPTLNDILNASQLDIRSSAGLPKATDTEVAEVRSDAPLRQAFSVGPNVTRLDKIAIWFSGWSPSWTPEKSLVMRLYSGRDFSRVLAEATEPYSRRSWEGAVHVFTLNIAVAQNAEYTFELTTIGGVSLTGAALAVPPDEEGVGPLTRNGETLPGALWFETTVKRRSDLDLLYLDVFAHFDLLRPDMSAVRQAVAVRDWDRAKRALVAHFESRKDLFPDEPKPALKSSTALQAKMADANLIVQHKLRAVDEIVDMGPRWNHMAAWRTRGGVGLTRSGLRGVLAAAYTQTHDERYARAWDAMLRFQFEDLPSPLRAGIIPADARDIQPIGEPGIGGGSMWASLSIGARMAHGFAYYRAFRNSPSFTLDTRFAFIANLAEMSDVLEKMKGGGNWEAQNTTALLEFGSSFPEFRKAAAWQARGFAGALQNCLDNTFPDGPLREATTNYHSLSLNRYLGVLETEKRRPLPGLIVPPIVRDRVEKMCDYLLYSTMPNGQLPRWGDSNPPVDALSLLLRGAEFFSRPDMRWVATGGKAGTPPKVTSTAFPEAGYYLMRSGWDPDAAFLALHNGHSSAHGHNDVNSLVLTAFGNELLIDPGIYIYGTPEAQLLTRGISHNTVTMDEASALNDKGEAYWTSGQWFDIYDGTNAGYEGQKRADSEARHRRIIVFLKPSLFFVVDAGVGDRQHDWALRDHFAPGTVTAATDGKSITFRPAYDSGYPARARGGLRIWSAAQNATTMTLAPGLAAGGWERKIETPVAIWSQFQTRTACWANLLEPFAVSPATSPWDVRQDENGTAMAFQHDGHNTRYVLVRTQPEAAFPDSWAETTSFSTDAEVAAYEERIAEKSDTGFHRLLVHSATLFLQPNAETPALLRSEQPIPFLEATWQGDTLSVRREGGSGIVLRTFGARWLLLDGKRMPIAPGAAICRLPDQMIR